MRLRYVCLCILIFAVGAASAQGFSIQQSFGMNSGFDDDFMNFSVPGFSMDTSFPDFGFEFNTTSSSDFSQAYSFFSEYYAGTPMPIVGIVSTPVKIDISHKMPSEIYYGGHKIAYSKYTSAVASSRGNELWIQGASDWSQYVMCPAGVGIQLIAFAPQGGQAELYDIFQTTYPAVVLNVTDKQYPLYPLYNSMYFAADRIGRHILLFVLNGQPSNAIIIDVTPVQQMPPANNGQMPQGQNPYPQTYNQQYSQQQYTSAQMPSQVPVYTPISGDTPVTIQTTMKGYDVYLDGVLIGKEGTGGDPLDGIYRFTVIGNQMHTIRVFDGMNPYEKTMYFDRGVAKIINVPPASTVYVSGGLI